ncbi:MAG: AsmA family protein [Gammaproteobacteria bacterium]
MKRLIKAIFVLIGLVLALLAGTVIIAPLVLDPNDYKDRFTVPFEEQTGRSLSIEGDIKLSVFPWLGFDLGAIRIGNAEGFGTVPFLKSERARAHVELLPLLRREVRVDKVSLQGLVLNLARAKDGTSNWDDLVRGRSRPDRPTEDLAGPEAPAETGSAAEPPAIAALVFGGLDIEHAEVNWEDAQTGERYAVKELDLETGPIALGDPVDVALAFGFDAGRAGISGHLDLGGRVSADLAAERYAVRGLKAKGRFKGKSIPGGQTDLKLKADVESDLAKDTASVQGLDLAVFGLSVAGGVEVTQVRSARPGLSYKLKAKGDDLSALMQALATTFEIDGVPKSLSRLRVDLGLAGNLSRVAVEPLLVDAALSTSGTKGPVTLALSAKRLDLDLDSKAVAVSAGRLKVSGADVVPVLKELGLADPGLAKLAIALDSDSEFSGTGTRLSVAPFNAKATLAGASIPGGSAEVSLATRADLDLKQQTLVLDDLALKGLGLDLSGGLRATGIPSDPKLSGNMKIAPFDARALLQQLGQEAPDTADPKALTRVGLDAAVAGNKNSVSLSNLVMRLDDTQIKGKLAIVDLSHPGYEFNLAADQLDLDRYLASEGEGQGEPGAEAKPAALKPEKRPAGPKPEKKHTAPEERQAGGSGGGEPAPAGLRGLNLKGQLSVAKLKVSNARLSNVQVTIDARNGQIVLSPIAANLYQGSLAGQMRIDARGAQPKITLDQNLKNVEIEPLLVDVSGESKWSGRGNVEAKITASGADGDSIKRTLDGTGSIQLRDGAMKGVNLGQLLRQVKGGLSGKAVGSGKTDFSEIGGTFNIRQGVVHNQDLAAKSPLLRVDGKGKADLVNERIDYLVDALLTDTFKGQGGKEAADLSGVKIPVRITGSFDAPSFLPDFTAIAKAQAEKLLSKNKEKITEKLKEKLGDDTGGVLGGVLGKFLGGKEEPAPGAESAQPEAGDRPRPTGKQTAAEQQAARRKNQQGKQGEPKDDSDKAIKNAADALKDALGL